MTAMTTISSSLPTREQRPSLTLQRRRRGLQLLARDAASGGSVGYDHKMGITARGAWESVKRHFRELGIDTQSEDFTVTVVDR